MKTVSSARISDFPLPAPGTERFDTLCQLGNVTIERIVSSGTQPPGRYCQGQDEWVLLLQGEAELEVAETRVTLRAGDYVALHAGVPHVVVRTSENALWLAVHVHPQTQVNP
jgi:cupin 2 domain-containing protein